LENVIAGSVFPAEQEQNSGDRIYFGLADVRCSHGRRRVLGDRSTDHGVGKRRGFTLRAGLNYKFY
jgi:hypothetical protein